MRSVGLPELEHQDADAPIPEVLTQNGRPSFVPIVVIVALGALLIWALSALGGISSSPEIEQPDFPEPNRDDASNEAVTNPDPGDVSNIVTITTPSRADVDLLGLGGGAHVAVDEFDDAPIVADDAGFYRVAPVDGVRRVLFSPTGAVWHEIDAVIAPEFENGMPIDGLATSPNGSETVTVFRSADGVVVSVGAADTITIPTLPESELADLVVGDTTAYLTIEEPSGDRERPRYSVLRVTYGDDFDVRWVDLEGPLGQGFERLHLGTILEDGTIIAIATDRANSAAKLVEFGPDSVREIELDDIRMLNLRRTSTMYARGNDLIAIDRDALVYTKAPDEDFFVGSTLPIHPILSASRNGVLVSLELLADTTVLRAWLPDSPEPREVVLQGRIEPTELVAINSTEALLRTKTLSGEPWLIHVPFTER